MRFHDSYQLQEVIADGRVKTVRAIEVHSGRAVFLHLLCSSFGPATRLVLEQIRSLTPSAARAVLLIDTYDEITYVVTQVLQPFTNLEEWLASNCLHSTGEIAHVPREEHPSQRPRFAGKESLEVLFTAGGKGIQQALNGHPRGAKQPQARLAQLEQEQDASPSERFALWCYSEALRMRQEGNNEGAREIAGQGLAYYRGESTREDRPARRSARERLKAGWAERLGAPAFRRYGNRPLVAAVMGATAALLMVAVGSVVWRPAPPTAEVVRAYPVNIRTSPPGAAISVNGEECGASRCDVELAPGTYWARAHQDGYQMAATSFEVSDTSSAQANHVILTLQPLAPTIRLASDLTGGHVSLDGESVGMLRGGEFELQLDALSAGEHWLTISHGSSQASIAFETEPGSLPVLRRPPATRNLTAAIVTGLGSRARVYSGGEIIEAQLGDASPVRVDERGFEWTDVSPGVHDLTLVSGPDRRRFALLAGPKPILAAFLKADRSFGGLRIRVDQRDVDIYLNGKKYQRPAQDGELLVYLYPKVYRVRVDKAGFISPPEQSIHIRKGERVHLNFNLVPEGPRVPLLVRNGSRGREVVALDGSPQRVGFAGGITASF